MKRDIDYAKVFEVLDTITGLPLKRKGSRWFGSCYLDGSPSDRWDKISCRLVPDGIQLMEQGMGGTTLWNYLKDRHGLSNSEVGQKLSSLSASNIIIPPPKPPPPTRYVYSGVIQEAVSNIGVVEDEFFLFLCRHFGRKKAISAYRLYNVTPLLLKDGRIATTFWYVRQDGKILHDKGILYKDDGHRDKSFGGCRRFKIDYGYRERCYFGEHLLGKIGNRRIMVVESEKTALLLWLYYGQFAMATGGSNCLYRVEPGWIPLPDWDKAGDLFWCRYYPEECQDWWNEYPDVPIERGWDIGDVIMYKLNQKENGPTT